MMQKLIAILIPRFAWLYLHFVGHTSKIVFLNRAKREKLETREKNFIYAFWHGRQVMIPWIYRNLPYACLVSQSKDGETIARVIHHFGMLTVRGSSSRGAFRAIVELKKKS